MLYSSGTILVRSVDLQIDEPPPHWPGSFVRTAEGDPTQSFFAVMTS